MQHADLFGNFLSYFYTDQFSGVFNNMLDHIVDSFGQTISFGYGANAIVVTTPTGAQTTINVSARGVENVQDALGNYTVFNYAPFGNQMLLASIAYPTGLLTQMTLTGLAYIEPGGTSGVFATVSDLYHVDSTGAIFDHTSYAYGTDTGGNTYTGATAGYQLSSGGDSLMDSNNNLFVYDVLVTKQDAAGNVLSASRIYFNYLHLPTREEHYLVSSGGQIANGFRALYTYSIAPNAHARATNYSQPIQTEQFVFSATSNNYLPLRKSLSSYDAFGQILSSQELMFDSATQQYQSQIRSTHTYVLASWGGEMLSVETYTDDVSGYSRQISYTLTADQKCVASALTSYQVSTGTAWTPWKIKSFTYDSNGRTLSSTLRWASGGGPGPITTSTTTMAYSYNPSNHQLNVATTDPLGNCSTSTMDVSSTGGPTLQVQTPMGATVRYAYDLLGRVVSETDANGSVTTTAYALYASGGVNSATASGPLGYVVAHYFDAMGREIQIMDNGDPTQASPSVTRVLRQVQFNALGSVAQTSNELGLTTTNQYDSLNRLISSTDAIGNISTTQYDDATQTVTTQVNGITRTITVRDGLGRIVSLKNYADPSDAAITYTQLTQSQFNGFGLLTQTTFSTVPTGGGAPQILYMMAFTYDVEGKVATQNYVGSIKWTPWSRQK